MRNTNHLFAFLMVVLTFSIPFTTLAQPNWVAQQAKADAEADANKDVNKLIWFGTGCVLSGLVLVSIPLLPGVYTSCLLPPAGIAGTYFYQPDPPVSRFLGKEPEYVSIYTSTYKSRRGRIQSDMSSIGCATGCGILGLTLTVVGFALGEFQEPLE